MALAWAPWGLGRILCYSSDKGAVYIAHLDSLPKSTVDALPGSSCKIRIRQILKSEKRLQLAGFSSSEEDGSSEEFEEQEDGQDDVHAGGVDDGGDEDGEADDGEGEEEDVEVWQDEDIVSSSGSWEEMDMEELEGLEHPEGAVAPDVSGAGWEGGVAQSAVETAAVPELGGGSAGVVRDLQRERDQARGEESLQAAVRAAAKEKLPLTKPAGLNGIVLTEDGHLLVATKVGSVLSRVVGNCT